MTLDWLYSKRIEQHQSIPQQPQGVFRILSNIYDEAFPRELLRGHSKMASPGQGEGGYSNLMKKVTYAEGVFANGDITTNKNYI